MLHSVNGSIRGKPNYLDHRMWLGFFFLPCQARSFPFPADYYSCTTPPIPPPAFHGSSILPSPPSAASLGSLRASGWPSLGRHLLPLQPSGVRTGKLGSQGEVREAGRGEDQALPRFLTTAWSFLFIQVTHNWFVHPRSGFWINPWVIEVVSQSLDSCSNLVSKSGNNWPKISTSQ